ncbi:MAG TPA: carbamoyltransferase C-terminal domain-containing protein [Methanomicrobiales archaeon]|nr:carbamoyltransferase C-terminal domain-containing protein [Methanomicrobiales archaeon]
MRVLGINDGINGTACLLEDGVIRYCIQEERLTNIKNYIGFPRLAVAEILKQAAISGDDLDAVAIASFSVFTTPDPALGLAEVYHRTDTSPLLARILDFGMKTPLYSMYSGQKRKRRLANLDEFGIPGDRIVFLDHHLCHAASAYYACPWKEEDVLVLTCDGSGDGLCATVYTGKDGALTKVAETAAGSSIGDIYARVTFMLGFVPHEHEWKIMGMAPYAPPKGTGKSYERFRKYLSVPDGSLTFRRDIPEPTNLIYRRLRRDFEFHRFDWICGGVQGITEDLLEQWVRNAIRKTGIRKVALAGGVFMNVKANKRIMEMAEVSDLFVFPSCGDESTAIGAAYRAYAEKRRESGEEVKIPPLGEIYFGLSFTGREVEEAVARRPGKLLLSHSPDIEKEVAALVEGGAVVARCKDRMEFGARALGNRSILADPANQGCVRTINMMVKKRDFWMPFAPVVSRERQDACIVNPKRVKSPHMMLSFDTTGKREEFIAAVHPADLTARAQILEEAHNPAYYRILTEFERLTGRPVLLNTSFNLHGYPIVHGPEEALWVFENSGLEYLALGDFMITREHAAGA